MNSTTKQEESPQHGMTGQANNPEGVGGFGDNPENRSDGRWNKEGSIGYQYNKLIRLSAEELDTFQPTTIAEKIAIERIRQAVKAGGLHDAKEVTDRTEGKAPQKVDITTNDESLNLFSQLSVEELKRLANS